MHGTLEQQVGDEHIRAARIALRTGAVMLVTAAVGYVAFVAIAFWNFGPNYTMVPSPAPSAR